MGIILMRQHSSTELANYASCMQPKLQKSLSVSLGENSLIVGYVHREKMTDLPLILVLFYIRDAFERGTMALDDLTVESGECPPEPRDGSCDFDWGESCGYTFGGKNNSWNLKERPEEFSLKDYSSGGMLGGMAYLEADGNRLQESFTSPTLPGRENVQCLQFHYYMSGSDKARGNLLTTVSATG
ncbi:apical endosomal glycoprotein [Rhipicephalus sanguineus]|uniref:apical endosomal glycoprotein n=1 Tax=Rhipicephalus sanguineus TaxID=34632 RepID=UPI0020C34940|nr:apical endosomal glycoprotein [Rhipicephalus sanguineus]